MCISIPVFNEINNLENCINSLCGQSDEPDEVLFIDNCSTDGSGEYIKSRLNEFKMARLLKENNKGIPFVRNRAVLESDCDIVAFLDGDCVAPANYVAQLKKHFSNLSINAVSGRYKLQGKDRKIIEFREREWESYFGWSGNTRTFEYLEGLKGTIVSGCSAFKKSALMDLGLFDTRIKYLDDILLSLKFYSAGFKSLVDPSLIVMHKIETGEYDLFQKEFNYGADSANINKIYGTRFAIYPRHWKKLIRCGTRYLFKRDLFAGYQARMLLYNKLGMLANGLQRGALYI